MVCHAGNFGMMDPMSKDLHTYLSRLEEQQRQVCSFCKGTQCACQVGSPALSYKHASLH